MKYGVKLLFIVVLVISSSGCPANLAITYGLWIFSLSNSPGSTSSIALVQNGLTVHPLITDPGVEALFSGTVTWQQSGSAITLNQDGNLADFVYTGTVQSPTSMNGTFSEVGNASNSGTWTAEFGPEN